MSSQECPQCGTKIGSMQVHSDHECARQQRINERNRDLDTPTVCPWCGTTGVGHKSGCPRLQGCT